MSSSSPDLNAAYQQFTSQQLSRAPHDASLLNKVVRPSLTYWQDAWYKLRHNPVAILGLCLLVIYVVLAALAPLFSQYGYDQQDYMARNLSPCAEHWFGTDAAGRDLWVRNWMGARVSLTIGLLVVLINTALGVIVGGTAGYFGGKVDMAIMRVVDVLYGIPTIILAILLMVVMGPGIASLIIAMVCVGWIGSARLVRGQVLQLKNMEYVMAARTLGASDSRIIFRHMIPNISGIIITNMTMAIPNAIFTEAFLSYIGLGVQPPNCSWGSLAQTASEVYKLYPYQLIIPAIFICTTMLSLNMLGDGLRDALDPKMH